MKNKIKKILKNKKIISYLAIFFISFFICIPLFSKYIDISRDDGIQHICRLIGTMDTLKQGNVFPVIMSEFCNGFGYSWNIFYSPFTAYIPLIFSIFTSSYVVMLKLFMFATVFLSGIFMYQFVYKITRSYKASVIAAIIYMGSPYHLTDIYNRIAIAELASFIFLPILFNGMYDLFRRRNKIPYGIIFGGIGLVLTHNVMAVYAAILCLAYLLIKIKKVKNKRIIKNILVSVLLIVMCTSFYWVPLVEHYLATTYEVFIPQRMYKDNTLISSKLSILELFFTKHYEMNFHIGLLILIGLLLIFLYRKRIPNRYRGLLKMFATFGFISIIMTLRIFPFEYLGNILKMIQFPWRMMEFATFFLSILSGIGIAMFMNRKPKNELYVVVLIFIVLSISIIGAKKEIEIPFNEERYKIPIAVTNITGRVHAGCASFEYLPKKAFQNRSYIEQRNNEPIVLEGNAQISEISKEHTNLQFTIQDLQENTKIELPYIYYLGYEAIFIKEDGSKVNIPIQESENGFCIISLPSIENGKIEIKYTGTTLMKLSYLITISGIIYLIYYSNRTKLYKRKTEIKAKQRIKKN